MSSQSDSEGTSGRLDDCGIVLNAVQGGSAIAEALRRRRSIKMYRPDQIALATMSRLLGEAVGSAPDTRRPYGSAHARYDIQVTVVAAAVDGLDPGAYKYLPEEHSLAGAVYGDHRTGLAEGTLDAAWLRQCPLILVPSADLSAANRAFESQRASPG